MDKKILKNIAKEWAAGILLATGMDSFDNEGLTYEEEVYIIKSVHQISKKIRENPSGSLTNIVEKYYEFE